MAAQFFYRYDSFSTSPTELAVLGPKGVASEFDWKHESPFAPSEGFKTKSVAAIP